MAHDRSGIATIDGAEEQRVEVRGAWVRVGGSRSGRLSEERRAPRPNGAGAPRRVLRPLPRTLSTRSWKAGKSWMGKAGRRGRMGAEQTPPARWQSFLVTAVALVVLLFAAVGLAVLLFAAALWAAMRGRRPVTRR